MRNAVLVEVAPEAEVGVAGVLGHPVGRSQSRQLDAQPDQRVAVGGELVGIGNTLCDKGLAALVCGQTLI